jgi:putative flavoprotein involved in K+ transport
VGFDESNIDQAEFDAIVAMADYQEPKTPAFATDLDPSIIQMHSSDYNNPGQLQDGNVLVVGLGNSGADIAYEVAKTHHTMASAETML